MSAPQLTLTPEESRRAEELLKDGASYREVVRTLGVSDKVLRRSFPGYGWTKGQGREWGDLKRRFDALPY